jgi:hypothetical protein
MNLKTNTGLMKKTRIHTKVPALLILLLCASGSVTAQEKEAVDFELFGGEEMLNVSLRFDITEMMKKKSTEDYQDAVLVYYFDSGDSLVNNIRVRARGNRRLDLCAFPPLRLNFKNCENSPSDLEGIPNVKLVTHCMSNKKFEEYILKEYLGYKLYNIVSDTSFRVRLMKINYIDTGRKGFSENLYGFVIEPLDLLCRRIEALELENLVVRSQYIDPETLDKVCMFQYMIGNEDWFLANLHNLKLYEPINGNKALKGIVPYDFDYSGLVNTYYAVPAPVYGLNSIQDRIYAGKCRSDDEFRRLADYFLKRKDIFIREIESLDLLEEKERKRTIKYIESFFDLYKRDYIIFSMKKTCAE